MSRAAERLILMTHRKSRSAVLQMLTPFRSVES